MKGGSEISDLVIDYDPDTLARRPVSVARAMRWLGGDARPIYQGSDDASPIQGFMAFSRDGRQLAFWESHCVQHEFAEPTYCAAAELKLVMVDVGTAEAHVVARGSSPSPDEGSGGTIAFSDDGTQIAYRYGAELHLRPTR